MIKKKKEPEIYKDGVKLVLKQDDFYVPIKISSDGSLMVDVGLKKNGVERAIERLDKNTRGSYDCVSMFKDNEYCSTKAD